MFKCKDKSDRLYNLDKKFIQGAWVSAVTLCNQNLYTRTITVASFAVSSLTGAGGVRAGGSPHYMALIRPLITTTASGMRMAGTATNSVT